MDHVKFSNERANSGKKDGKIPVSIKRADHTDEEEIAYYPVMIELGHLLDMTHNVLNEDEIVHRIRMMEQENPDSVLTNGVFWQTREDEEAMLLDERTLTVYKDLFEEYLNPELVESLKNFLEETNKNRIMEYLSADNEEIEKFRKIMVVTLT